MAPKWDTDEEGERLAAELLKPVDHAAFAMKVADKRFNYYVSTATRSGFATLSALVEYRIFHPTVGPESNDDFFYFMVVLNNVPFSVFAAPYRFEAAIAEFAAAIDMRIVKAYPTVIGPKGVLGFPGHREAETGRYNLFSVENGRGSQIYLNRSDLNAAIGKREGEIVDLLMQYGHQIPLAAIREYLWLGIVSASASRN